ncbi:hypothetical protein Y032_0005g2514 [Ancylostoma ceylanicum]|uniref:Uncharacterized protein n=1 Tax=Ancylostoma ceylanicum TaxID=53326 RepID=A0A016VRL4_9BILA|nr:hypothetical protein Y032_0005g2514 [Ancylostoma ceylanicum]
MIGERESKNSTMSKRMKYKVVGVDQPSTWDAPRIRLHLSIVEALNEYVPYKLTCGGHRMNQVSASSSQTPLVPIYRPRGMDGMVGHGRDRTIDRVRVQRASYHCATRAQT